MPTNSKEYQKQYFAKEENKAKKKEYYEKNKEKKIQYAKEYREKNKEKLKEKRQTEEYQKRKRIRRWKGFGVICDDWDTIYEKWKSCKNCEECGCEIFEKQSGMDRKCLDHDHKTGEFRNILCCRCNINNINRN